MNPSESYLLSTAAGSQLIDFFDFFFTSSLLFVQNVLSLMRPARHLKAVALVTCTRPEIK